MIDIASSVVDESKISSYKEQSETKTNVIISTLASTTVTNASNQNVTASTIYSEYDLAYFRDSVNGGQSNLNGKLMNNINLSNVCSQSIGSWTPIGYIRSSDVDFNTLRENVVFLATYKGVFDGNLKSMCKCSKIEKYRII